MLKITNGGLTQSSTGCFIAVPVWQQWASSGSDCKMKIWCVNIVANQLICHLIISNGQFGSVLYTVLH